MTLRLKESSLDVEKSNFAVYMAPASGFGSRLWTWVFDRLTCMSIRCNPVTISAHLSRNGFIIQKEVFVQRLGFSVIYSVSERPIPAA